MRFEDFLPVTSVRPVTTGATLEVVLGVVALIAPYYWLPGMSVASLSLIKNALVVTLGLIWTPASSQTDGSAPSVDGCWCY